MHESNTKNDDSDEDDHNKVMMNLLMRKLTKESVSPTKLKVEENLQNNVNFYSNDDCESQYSFGYLRPDPRLIQPKQFGGVSMSEVQLNHPQQVPQMHNN